MHYPKLTSLCQLYHYPQIPIKDNLISSFIYHFLFPGGHLCFFMSCSPFLNPRPSFLSVPSSMLNENQTFSRPNQDVLNWMSLIMGWVNSEFRCCRGIKSRDKPELIERNDTDIAQWALVSNNYYLFMSEGEEQIFSVLPNGFEWILKTWGSVNTVYDNISQRN